MPKKIIVPGAAPEGEQIFPASQLTPLAVKWKELSAAGRHKEAMFVLEQIIVGSTSMFERLAQFEDFHYTVDLPILVSAAQERVVKWLLAWQPKKGRLFSWFSKSYAGDTWIILSNGSALRIDDIVEHQRPLDVLSWNQSTGLFEPKPVIAWHKTPADLSKWRLLKFKCPGLASNWKDSSWKRITLTADHEVYTNRGRVRVDDLEADDKLYTAKPEITPDGMSALIGMYLGDGSIAAKNYFVVAHGTGQEVYTRHVAEIFGNRKVWFNHVTLKCNGKTYPVWRTRLLLKRIWPSCPLRREKNITEWLLDNLNPVALAYWYMDDGHLASAPHNTGRRIPILCCENFGLEDQIRIAERLWADWNIRVSPQKYKGKYRLTVLDESVQHFFEIVREYLLPCFAYKVPENLRARVGRKLIKAIRYRSVPCEEWSVKPIRVEQCGTARRKMLECKYDITVADNHNVVVMQAGKTQNGVAAGLCAVQCAKNAFRSELVKVNQYRKRNYVTSDSLERFYGMEDHEINKHDLAKEFYKKFHSMTCRWGDPQEIAAIRYLIECIVDDERDKHCAIRGAAYAYGISMEMSKFFYAWAVAALRHELYDKVHIPFTQEDLFRASLSYEHVVDLLDYVSWDVAKKILARWQGMRIKFPTLAYMARLHENYLIYGEIDKSSLDPDAIAEVARRRKRTPRSAQEIFNDMVTIMEPNRTGEYDIYTG